MTKNKNPKSDKESGKLDELNQKYELELDKIAENIEKNSAKVVLLQFPDGLKQYATEITNYLKSQSKETNFIIWLGTCYGACDMPVLNKKTEEKIDLVIQFGHNELMPTYVKNFPSLS